MKIFIAILSMGISSLVFADELDYSFARPLVIESKLVNGFRFDIIRPDHRFENPKDPFWTAEDYRDNFLIVRDEWGDNPSIVAVEMTTGELSFKLVDELVEKFGQYAARYVVISEWIGTVSYHVYSTAPEFTKILELNTTNDYYKLVAANQLEVIEGSDVEGVWNCPRSLWPFDTVVYTFYPDRAERNVVALGEIPECAKAVTETTSAGNLEEKVWSCTEVESIGWTPQEEGGFKQIELKTERPIITELNEPPYLQFQDDYFVTDGCDKIFPGSATGDSTLNVATGESEPSITDEIVIQCFDPVKSSFYFYPSTGIAKEMILHPEHLTLKDTSAGVQPLARREFKCEAESEVTQ